jgi:hypothetical protein
MAFVDIKLASEPAFVFHHIPKTAGTSFMAVLHNWFNVISDYEGLFKNRHDFRMHPVDVDKLSANTILAGHWNTAVSGMDLRYPSLKGNPRFQFFTFLRNPLQMHISLFNYRWKMNPEDCKKHQRYHSLDAYLASTRNRVAELMGCSEMNYETVLRRYYFIGITEKMDVSLAMFYKKTLERLSAFSDSTMSKRQMYILQTKPAISQPRLNVVKRTQDSDQISQEALGLFMERNALDYMIYSKALELHEAEKTIIA